MEPKTEEDREAAGVSADEVPKEKSYFEQREILAITEENEEDREAAGVATGEAPTKKSNFQQRHILAIMGFFSIAVGYFARVNIGVTLTQMVKIKQKNRIVTIFPNYKNFNQTNIYHLKYSSEYNEYTEHFNWNELKQGNILSAFFFGYLISHVPGGILSEKLGGKIVLIIALLLSAISSTLTPLITMHGGYIGLCFCRVCQGLSQGVILPGLSYLLGRWFPKQERGRFGSFVYGGGQFGALAGNFLSGILVSHINWYAPFYAAAILAIVWVVIFIWLCTNDPLSHPRITKSEREYLIAELGEHIKKETPPKPWKQILKSKICLSYFFCQSCFDWGFYVIAINLPKYMDDVVNVSVKTNGIINAVGFLFMWIMSLVAGAMADYLYINNIYSLTNIRKFMTTMCFMIPALFMVFAGYGTDIGETVFFFIMGVAFMGFFFGGIILTPLDISPNFSPTIMAIGNGLGAVVGFAAPNIIGLMTPNATRQQWQSVFLLTLLIRFIGTIVYSIFTTSEIQPWDDPVGNNDAVEANKSIKNKSENNP